MTRKNLIVPGAALLLAFLATSADVSPTSQTPEPDRRISGRITRIIQQSVQITPGHCYDPKSTCDTPRSKPVPCCTRYPKLCCDH